MNIYNKIIDNIVRTDDNWFEYNYKPSNNVSYILKVCFAMLQQGKIYKSRILFFYDQINNNLIRNYREEFELLFNKIQHYYYILVRFANMCKYKRAKILVNIDLQLNEIKETDKGVLSILHCEKKYLFKYYELIKHINMNLTNSPCFFAAPMQIKNPYNGIPFSKSILYNIYFYVKFNTSIQMELFHKYFLNHFNIFIFEIENEPIIREYAIKNYLNNSTHEILNGHLLNMLDEYNCYYMSEYKIEIDVDFPKQKLIKIMKPYLKLYLYSLYSMNVGKKQYYQNLLYKKLLKFNKYNNKFGKKIIRTEKIFSDNIYNPPKIVFHHEFSEEHIKYNSVDLDKFMTNHLNIPFLETSISEVTNRINNQNTRSLNNTINNHNNHNNININNPTNQTFLMLSAVVNNISEIEGLLQNVNFNENNDADIYNQNSYNQYTNINNNDNLHTITQQNPMFYNDTNNYDESDDISSHDTNDEYDNETDSVS